MTDVWAQDHRRVDHVWAVLWDPACERLAPMLQVLVPILRRDGELDLSDGEAALPAAIRASTIDRRVA